MMFRIFIRVALPCAIVWSSACASAPIRKDEGLALAAADAKVLQGCYDCLLQARAVYTRVAVGRARPLVIARLFEVDLLLTLREKSLGLDWEASIVRARALVPELPEVLDAPRLLAAVEAVPPDETSTPVSDRLTFVRAHAAFDAAVEPTLAWLPSSPLTPAVARTVAMSVDCGYPPARPVPGSRRTGRGLRPEPGPGASQLERYEAANCQLPQRASLDALRQADPAFVETAYGISRMAVLSIRQDGGRMLRERLTEVYARFPQSPGVTYLFGRYFQLVGDCREALRYYDETIARRTWHEDALLGRTSCLGYLKRHGEALESATRMISRPTYNVDQAYYWRAWNHHVLKDLPAARRDIESAKSIRSSGEIFTLAGVIEHDQDDLPIAERDLKAARDAAYGTRNCTAAWYLGLVSIKLERWSDASTWFEAAMSCYDDNVLESEAGLAAMLANTTVDPEFRARQIAGFEAAIKEDRSQYHAAAFNAANHHARAGRPDRARELVEVAAKDPALESLVQQLRRILKGGGAAAAAAVSK